MGPVICHNPGEGPLLFDATFRPATKGVFPDRPRSPRRPGLDDTTGIAKAAAPAAKPAPYRPPGSSGALASLLAREAAPKGKVRADGGAAAHKPITPALKQRIVPGMSPQMAAVKPKPRRRNKDHDPESAVPSSSSKNQQRVPDAVPTPVPAPVSTPPPGPAVNKPLTAEEKEKKAKGLRKKLKQIEEIKAKRDAGSELNGDQRQKIDSEASLIAELRGLGI